MAEVKTLVRKEKKRFQFLLFFLYFVAVFPAVQMLAFILCVYCLLAHIPQNNAFRLEQKDKQSGKWILEVIATTTAAENNSTEHTQEILLLTSLTRLTHHYSVLTLISNATRPY